MFVHLHCHFLGSYSDSLLDPAQDLPYLKKMGQEAVAITDHGVLDFCFPFYWACREFGLHPVLGCEVYFVDNARLSIEQKNPYRNHLILLAKDNRGFLNLVKLVNQSWLDNNFGEIRGLVDWKLLERFHEGLIALSGCFWGSLPQKYINSGLKEAEKELERYYDIFGNDFYPELGRHGIAEEEKANEGLIALSRRYGLKPVVTNDCHYRTAPDWKIQDILIKTRFGFPTAFELEARNYYLKSEMEMRQLGFPDEYYHQTFEIACQCQVKLEEIGEEIAPQPFDLEKEAVFSSRLVKIDARQAMIDVTSVWGEEGSELKRIIERIPPGLALPAALEKVEGLKKWLGKRPQIREGVFKLHGLPRSSRPDFGTVINLNLSRLRQFLPLKRAQGEIMSQYPGWVLKKLSVPTLNTAELKEGCPALWTRVKKLTALQLARQKLKQSDFSAAALLLEGIIRSDPREMEAHYLLANALYLLRRYQKAIEEYNFLAEHNFNIRKMPLVYVRQGWAYNWLGQAKNARLAFEKSLAVEKSYPPAHYALGILNYREGKYRPAVQELKFFLKLKPEGKRADKARGLLSKMGWRKTIT